MIALTMSCSCSLFVSAGSATRSFATFAEPIAWQTKARNRESGKNSMVLDYRDVKISRSTGTNKRTTFKGRS